MNETLSIKNLTKRFGGLVAVDDLSFDVKKGTIHSLIGPNGSGKTTTLNMIAGTLVPTDGSIFYNEECLDGLTEFKRANKGIGRTFQNIKLFPSMTVLENVMIGAMSQTKIGMTRFLFDFIGSNNEEKRLIEQGKEILNTLDIYNLKDVLVKNLPYGHQKILELGRAIINKPDLILLDEPAAGLNPSERSNFIDKLIMLNQEEITFLLIEHNMDIVMTISDKITVINFGKKIAEDVPVEIQNNDEVIKAYLGNQYVKQE